MASKEISSLPLKNTFEDTDTLHIVQSDGQDFKLSAELLRQASNIPFDDSETQMGANNVQDAIDTLVATGGLAGQSSDFVYEEVGPHETVITVGSFNGFVSALIGAAYLRRPPQTVTSSEPYVKIVTSSRIYNRGESLKISGLDLSHVSIDIDITLDGGRFLTISDGTKIGDVFIDVNFGTFVGLVPPTVLCEGSGTMIERLNVNASSSGNTIAVRIEDGVQVSNVSLSRRLNLFASNCKLGFLAYDDSGVDFTSSVELHGCMIASLGTVKSDSIEILNSYCSGNIDLISPEVKIEDCRLANLQINEQISESRSLVCKGSYVGGNTSILARSGDSYEFISCKLANLRITGDLTVSKVSFKDGTTATASGSDGDQGNITLEVLNGSRLAIPYRTFPVQSAGPDWDGLYSQTPNQWTADGIISEEPAP